MNVFSGFCGAGGETCGALAAGCTVVAALNHWDRALTTHRRNHPTVQTFDDNALDFDWTRLPRHDAAWLSPECIYFAFKARGGRPGPERDASRATALCVGKLAHQCRSPVLLVENVPEYADSPECALVTTYLTEQLDYYQQRFVLDAADYGAATHRVRFYQVFSLRPFALTFHQRPSRTVREALDLTAGDWSPVEPRARRRVGLRPLCVRTRAQIDLGLERYQGGPFLVPYYGSKRRDRVAVRSVDRPIGALTTKDRYGLSRRLDGRVVYRMFTPAEQARLMGFPDHYVLTGTRQEQVRQVGNAVTREAAEALYAAVREAA